MHDFALRMPMMPLYHTPPAHTKPTPGVFIGAAWLGWTLGVCGCPPGPAQTVGGLRLHLRLRVGLRLSHSDNLSSHIPKKHGAVTEERVVSTAEHEHVNTCLHSGVRGKQNIMHEQDHHAQEHHGHLYLRRPPQVRTT